MIDQHCEKSWSAEGIPQLFVAIGQDIGAYETINMPNILGVWSVYLILSYCANEVKRI